MSCRAKEEYFEIIKSSLTNDKVPNYNDFNTQRNCHSGQSLKSKSKVYLLFFWIAQHLILQQC